MNEVIIQKILRKGGIDYELLGTETAFK